MLVPFFYSSIWRRPRGHARKVSDNTTGVLSAGAAREEMLPLTHVRIQDIVIKHTQSVIHGIQLRLRDSVTAHIGRNIVNRLVERTDQQCRWRDQLGSDWRERAFVAVRWWGVAGRGGANRRHSDATWPLVREGPCSRARRTRTRTDFPPADRQMSP